MLLLLFVSCRFEYRKRVLFSYTLNVDNDKLKVIGELVKVKVVTTTRRMLAMKFNDGATKLPALPTDEAATNHQIIIV